jgi:hypothetical protein
MFVAASDAEIRTRTSRLIKDGFIKLLAGTFVPI